MSAFEKNEVFKRYFFSAPLFRPIKMQTFLETSTNFHNDWRWYDYVTVYT